MAKWGRKRDLDREIRYWELIASGVGTVEACRRVGVTRKTGYRWGEHPSRLLFPHAASMGG